MRLDSARPRQTIRRVAAAGVAALGVGLLSAGATLSPVAQAAGPVRAAAPPGAGGDEAFAGIGLPDADLRTGSRSPSETQRSIADNLQAHVDWNRFGTPASLINYDGYLATGLGASEVDAARSFLSSHAALFKLTAADVDALELVNDSKMAKGGGHAVTFRQKFGQLAATQDGLVIVGIKGGKVAYVSSSLTGATATLSRSSATLTAKQAWSKAAQSVGFSEPGTLGSIRKENGWSVFNASNLVTPTREGLGAVDQRARLVALPTYTQGVRPAYETVVLHNTAGENPAAYIVFVDAMSGDVLFRQNAVDQFASGATMAGDSGFFQGTTGTNADEPLCGDPINIEVDKAGGDDRIDVVATADVPADDIIIRLLDPLGVEKVNSDSGTSPETADYVLQPTDLGGTWVALVCEFENVPDFSYSGFYQVSPTGNPPSVPFPPQWNFFTANPALPADPSMHPPFDYPADDTRTHSCWTTSDPHSPAGCQLDLTPNNGDTNLASRVPWDYNVQPNSPSYTTEGNNAWTAETWLAALTPGAFGQRPFDFDRTYGFGESSDPESPTGDLEDWTNQWNKSRCAPESFSPAGNNNDVLAAVTTLHSGHNRFHDYAYLLGFTERNYNLQVNNFGNTAPGPFPFGREGDPEVGNVQNGALLPSDLGLTRDNANQVTLQDGIPGITNQYLFQPIPGAFYAPCADGDLDAAIYGHEFTHAISNRMVGGPDSNLTGSQARAMGESWSDQVAVEYLNAYRYVPTSPGENPFAVGIYATGNKKKAIRNYALNHNPLNYSNIGYDMTCDSNLVGEPVEPDCSDDQGEEHSDGEVWNAIGYEVRQALVEKYNAQFPYGNAALQKRCADGNLPADKCPGNRRWIQIMFDAFLLQQASTDMVEARDAYLAADRMRFNGANQKALWAAFAERGLGSCSTDPSAACHATRSAYSNGTADDDPRPSFESPLQGEKTVKFLVRSAATGDPVEADVFIGRYEARSVPIADTAAGGLSDTARFVPGTYDVLVRADGYGHRRFRLSAAGTTSSTVSLLMTPNLASAANGAVATGPGANQGDLIDDTEATTWDVADTGDNVDVAKPEITVDLMGDGAQMVRSVRVSALLTPLEQRFTALRQFEIQACNAAPPVSADCSQSGSFQTIYTSPEDAFNAVAPRPVAPDLLVKSFDVTDTAATHVRLVALDNQCTGAPDYQGDQENDPFTPASTDCSESSARAHELHVAELQVLGTGADGANPPAPAGPKDPVVTVTKAGPLTANAGDEVTYTISFTNLGPAVASSAKLVDTLPDGVSFVSASRGGSYDGASGKVTWQLGNVADGASGSRSLVGVVDGSTAPGTLLLNQVTFRAPLTISTPGAFLTAVN